MNTSDLALDQFLQILAQFFTQETINYQVVGSIASMAYGEPRFTNDIDILVDLTIDKIEKLCSFFSPPDYYLSADAIQQALEQRFQFNIIHPTSGLKADIIIPPDTEFSHLQMTRAKQITINGYAIWFASPEDVILNKLIFYQMGGSQKHVRDIAGILKIYDGLDQDFMARWAVALGVDQEWQEMMALCQNFGIEK